MTALLGWKWWLTWKHYCTLKFGTSNFRPYTSKLSSVISFSTRLRVRVHTASVIKAILNELLLKVLQHLCWQSYFPDNRQVWKSVLIISHIEAATNSTAEASKCSKTMGKTQTPLHRGVRTSSKVNDSAFPLLMFRQTYCSFWTMKFKCEVKNEVYYFLTLCRGYSWLNFQESLPCSIF